MNINVRAEFECTPIRHIAIQCPYCNNWFRGRELVKDWDDLRYSYQIDCADYHCPMCGKDFGGYEERNEYNIESLGDAEKIYQDCKKQKITWE